jgi:hypothetical protein
LRRVSKLTPNVAKADGAVDPRRPRVEAVVRLRRTLGNAGDAVSSAFPKGKQHGCFSSFLDITRSEFHKIVQISRGERLLLVFTTFCHVVYATKGLL